jgi:ElaB/YqjD/DUF883 family membrane-anchored ribosome-binding protein
MTETESEQLRSEIEKLRADLASLTNTVQKIASHWGEEAKGAFSQSAGRMEEKARESIDKLAHQVEEKPIASVATAFGVGILIGLILNRRA